MKKAICLILSALLVLSCMVTAASAEGTGTTYYVDSVSGNDANSGTSESAAWKTAANILDRTFSAGDSVLFKRGGVYEMELYAKGSGTAEAPITFSDYGEGALPLITTNGYGVVFNLSSVSHWVLEDLEITAPKYEISKGGDGKMRIDRCATAIFMRAEGGYIGRGYTFRNLKIHDVFNTSSDNYNSSTAAAVRIQTGGEAYHGYYNDILFDGIELYDCAYGIDINGVLDDNAAAPDGHTDGVNEFHKNFTVINSYFHDLYDDGVIIGCTDGYLVRNTVFLNVAWDTLYFTCPIWSHLVNHGLLENNEVGGAANYMDGMAIDFDDRTQNTTVQYLYSHDNCKMMWACQWTAHQYNNVVRYCLSVNDGKVAGGQCNQNDMQQIGFKFYNNTLYNSANFAFKSSMNSFIQNNIFIMPLERVQFEGRDKLAENNNVISHNYYYGTMGPDPQLDEYMRDSKWKADGNVPFKAMDIFSDLGFAGSDVNDKNSFRLVAGSRLIGAGTQVEEDMGAHDFFGNPLTSTHNIGCYEGPGVSRDVALTEVTFDFSNSGSGTKTYGKHFTVGTKITADDIINVAGSNTARKYVKMNADNVKCRDFLGYSTDKNATSGMSEITVTENMTVYAIWGEPHHVWGDWVRSGAATCVHGTEQTHTCEVCGETGTRYVGAVSATNHVNKTDSAAVAATCVATGKRAYTVCADCGVILTIDGADVSAQKLKVETAGDRITVPVNASAHTSVKDAAATAATCVKEGSKAYTYCEACSAVLKIDGADVSGENLKVADIAARIAIPVDAGKHTVKESAAVAAKCEEAGKKAYTYCEACSAVLKIEGEDVSGENLKVADIADRIAVPATGHTPGQWKAVKLAGPGVTGLREKKCTVCGKVLESEEIPAEPVSGDVTTDPTSVTDPTSPSDTDNTTAPVGPTDPTGPSDTDKTTDPGETTEPQPSGGIVKGEIENAAIAESGDGITVYAPAATSRQAFEAALDPAYTYVIKNAAGEEIGAEAPVGTGAVVEAYAGDKLAASRTVVIMGDADGDGSVTATDARLALRAAAKLDTLEGAAAKACDCDGSNTIDATDARSILRAAAKLDSPTSWKK
ncbi:MAG: dockerin type I repeat-containing protein [Clostridia bacterium]|nr:dockerin type I repeat-containing protein [Clostridia bacterium]